jgi:cytochrome c-type biogenesis protein CcmH
MKKIFSLFLLVFLPGVLWAAQDFYPFKQQEQRERFATLTSELRCLVCQNQNIAESNAPLANDLRTQIYQKIQQGQSNQDIINYLVDRYGDFVLYEPPFRGKTLGLWLGPFLLLVSGISFLAYCIKKSRG